MCQHGFRANWSSSYTFPSPTGLDRDPPLTAFGMQQANELAKHLAGNEDKIDRIYCSSFYRCMQTATAFAELPSIDLPIHVETGIGEWYGQTTGSHPEWLKAKELASYFPRTVLDYEPLLGQNPTGETMADIHARVKEFLRRLVKNTDNVDGPRTVLFVTHAATNIALGRALTHQPEREVRTGCCSLGRYVLEGKDNGYGKWRCTMNGDCSFLTEGEQRNWEFDGDIPIEIADDSAKL